MLLGRDALALLSRSTGLASPQIGDAPLTVPPTIVPVTNLQGPIQSYTSVISNLEESTVRSATLVFSQTAGTANQPLLNMVKGVWRVKAYVNYLTDVVATYNQDFVWISINQAASGTAGTQLGCVAAEIPYVINQQKTMLYEDTLAMGQDFQVVVNVTAKAGTTIYVYAGFIAHRLL